MRAAVTLPNKSSVSTTFFKVFILDSTSLLRVFALDSKSFICESNCLLLLLRIDFLLLLESVALIAMPVSDSNSIPVIAALAARVNTPCASSLISDTLRACDTTSENGRTACSVPSLPGSSAMLRICEARVVTLPPSRPPSPEASILTSLPRTTICEGIL